MRKKPKALEPPCTLVTAHACARVTSAACVITRIMLKSFFLLLFSVLVATASDTLIPPLKAIQEFGGISISDGSSYYTFSKDGSFESGPLRLSGRTMNGRWVKDANGRLIATVRLGWVNGLSAGDQYRRIVFFISHVSKRAQPPKLRFGFPAELFDSFFFIDEMKSIPKPREKF